jgi:hypothetical protein
LGTPFRLAISANVEGYRLHFSFLFISHHFSKKKKDQLADLILKTAYGKLLLKPIKGINTPTS